MSITTFIVMLSLSLDCCSLTLHNSVTLLESSFITCHLPLRVGREFVGVGLWDGCSEFKGRCFSGRTMFTWRTATAQFSAMFGGHFLSRRTASRAVPFTISSPRPWKRLRGTSRPLVGGGSRTPLPHNIFQRSWRTAGPPKNHLGWKGERSSWQSLRKAGYFQFLQGKPYLNGSSQANGHPDPEFSGSKSTPSSFSSSIASPMILVFDHLFITRSRA